MNKNITEKLLEARKALVENNNKKLAEEIYLEVIKNNPENFEGYTSLAIMYATVGRKKEALINFKTARKLNPSNISANNNLGLSLQENGNYNEAEKYFKYAISIDKNYILAYYNLANNYKDQKNYDAAIINYQKVIKHKPEFKQAYNNMALVFCKLRQYDKAIEYILAALKYDNNYIEGLMNYGNILFELKKYDQSLMIFNRITALDPGNIDAKYNIANIYKELKEFNKAILEYQGVISLNNYHYQANYNLAVAFQLMREYKKALQQYEIVLQINPLSVDAIIGKGLILHEYGEYDEALAYYDKAIELEPEKIESYINVAATLEEINQYEGAVKSLEMAFKLDSKNEFLLGNIAHNKMKICDWSTYYEDKKNLIEGIEKNELISAPFQILGLLDDPYLQKKLSQLYWRKINNTFESNNIDKLNYKNKRIRVGYYSADFHNHATSYLIAELIEKHDKNKYEIYGFSFGPVVNDEMRMRISKAFEHFYELFEESDDYIADLSVDLMIDIAVDLKGYTKHSRTGIFRKRCAPIQINYLGYPGTMGTNNYDYIIADQIIIDKNDTQFYEEKILLMPNCYQVNDSKRRISDKNFTKYELGLPEDVFIFCCFNNNYKITPEIYDVWMEILKNIDKSILWLLEDNEYAVKNLKKEAEKRGVGQDRIIFSQRMDLPEHLARHKQADLFLDTYPYNAHTTASDALWSGLPLITYKGKSFASRVAASLLTSLGMDELIANSLQDYKNMAINMAKNENIIEEYKLKIDKNKTTMPLFNSSLFVEELEKIFKTVHSSNQEK